MKRIIAGCLLALWMTPALAGCNLTSSSQRLDYGKRSAAMRQADKGKNTALTGRSVTLVMQCDQNGHLRLQMSTSNLVNNSFGFGSNGSLNLVAASAISEGDSLDLALVDNKNDSPGSVGASSVTPAPNNWLVFLKNGQEAEITSNSSVSVTLTITPSFKDETAITDTTDITGNLNLFVEAQ